MTGEPTIIRCSALTGWPDCPRRGAARLFGAEIERAGYRLRQMIRGIGAAIGSSVHKGAAVALGEKARSGKLPPENVALDAAHETVREQIREGVTYDGARGCTHNQAQAERQVLGMTRTYHHQVAPGINAIRVEEKLEAQIARDIVLSGHPDLIAREPGQIRDLKTGLRQSSHAPQVGAYSLLARSHDLDIQTAAVDFIARVAVNKPQPDVVSTSVPIEKAEVAASNIIRNIADSLEVFRHGDPSRRILPGDGWAFMANPASNLCGEKWCPCWGVSGPHAFCNEWRPK